LKGSLLKQGLIGSGCKDYAFDLHVPFLALDLPMKHIIRKREKEPTILVIVHEYVVRHILIRMLLAKGFKVVAASIAHEGIRRFEKGKGKFDLVMIDMSLPGVSGLTVAKKIKQISQKTATMLIKGWDKELDPKKLKSSGVDFLLPKPFYMDKTLRIVEDALHIEAG
jgi:CheY-like chemotaxis protein